MNKTLDVFLYIYYGWQETPWVNEVLKILFMYIVWIMTGDLGDIKVSVKNSTDRKKYIFYKIT